MSVVIPTLEVRNEILGQSLVHGCLIGILDLVANTT